MKIKFYLLFAIVAIFILSVIAGLRQKKARTCESCHTNPKSMGYGINEGNLYERPDKDIVMDLTTPEGAVLPNQVDTQFTAIPNLPMDWSQIIDSTGRQMQTVGHHFSGSRPLNKNELAKLDRRGVCQSCHQTVPKKDLASDLLSHVAKYASVTIDKDEHQGILHKSVLISAWTQVIGGLLIIILIFFGWYRLRKSRQKSLKNP